MKNKKTKIGLLFASSLAFFAVTAAALVGVSNKSNAETKAASSDFTAETLSSSKTIYLKDKTDAEIKTYYSSLNGKSPSELSGTNLLKNLKSIITNGVKYYSYSTVGTIYAITDRDWTNSPANEIGGGGTYDSVNEQITGYSHTAEINARQTTDLYLHALYVDHDVKNKFLYKSDGDVSSTSVSFDKEHVWSQSHGFDGPDSGQDNLTGAGSDLHHLIAGAQYGNRTLHSNYSWGFVDVADSHDKTYEQGNKKGTQLSKSSQDNENIVFEPQDCDKGDIARALLYMVACYNKYDNSTATPSNPHLQLVDYVISDSTNGYSSTAEENGYYGILRDILAWHHMDPVDQYEKHRNNLIDRNYQYNRNPFIDYPEWVDYIWGTAEYNSSTREVTYNPTPTGYVDLNQDVINGYRNKSLTSISVTTLPTKTSYYKNDTLNTAGIVVTGTYDDGSTGDVTSGCTFSPTTLSTAGTQQITVTHSSGLTTSFNVTVSNTTRTLSSIAVTTMPTKTTYTQGDSFDPTGIVVTGTYSDNSTDEVTSGCTFSPTTLNAVGTQQITVTHTSTNKQTTFNVTVNEPPSTETLTITRSSFSSVAGYGTIDAWTASTSETSTSISGYAELFTNANYMQFNGANNNSLATGLFNTTAITGRITNITVNFNSSSASGRTMDVYVGTSALFTYSSSTLTNNTSSGTKVGTASTSATSFDVTGSNTYFALDKSSGALYIDSIVVTIATGSSPSDSVSLNKSSTSLTVGGAETLIATASGSVSWSSNNTDVVTVNSSGEITAVAAGTATVTATCGTASATCVVTVSDSTPTPTPSSDLAWTTNTTAYRKILFGSSYNSANVSSYENSWSTTNNDNDDSESFTVNLTNCYNYKSGWNYIKIGHKTNTNANTATMITDSSIGKPIGRVSINIGAMAVSDAVTSIKLYYDDNSSFSSPSELSFTKATGVQSVNITTPEASQYYKIEVVCTTNSTSNGVIQINEVDFYDATQATSYASQFLSAFTCDSTGQNEPTFATGFSWSVLKTNFNSLNSYDKTTLAGATANESGTTVEQAVARYDKVVSHWKYENFMSRSVTGLNNRTSFISNDNELFIVIIASSSIVSITAVGLYMLLKKRKEQ